MTLAHQLSKQHLVRTKWQQGVTRRYDGNGCQSRLLPSSSRSSTHRRCLSLVTLEKPSTRKPCPTLQYQSPSPYTRQRGGPRLVRRWNSTAAATAPAPINDSEFEPYHESARVQRPANAAADEAEEDAAAATASTGNFNGWSSNERQARKPLARGPARDFPSVLDKHANSSEGRHAILSAPTFAVGDLLRPRHITPRLLQFLQSPHQAANFAMCGTYKRFLQKFAGRYKLVVRRLRRGHPLLAETPLSDRGGLYLAKPLNWIEIDEGSKEDLRRDMIKYIEKYNMTSSSLMMRDIQESPTDNTDTILLASGGYQLMMTALRNKLTAIPTMSIIDSYESSSAASDGQTGDLSVPSSSSPTQMVRLQNESLNLSIEMPLNGTVAPKEATLNAIISYCIKARKLTSGENGHSLNLDNVLNSPQEFLSQAAHALGYGQVRYSDVSLGRLPLSTDSPDTLEFYQSSITMENRVGIGRPTIWTNAKSARLLSAVHACTAIIADLQEAHKAQRLPNEVYNALSTFWGEGDRIPGKGAPFATKSAGPSMPTVVASIDNRCIDTMLQALKDMRTLGFESPYAWDAADSTFDSSSTSHLTPRQKHPSDCEPVHPVNYATVRKAKAITDALPICQFPYRERIIDSIQNNDVTVIKAATGSGKSTQVPQFVLDAPHITGMLEACSIACTQPRRISAISVAERVANERGRAVGAEVGYQVRFKDKSPILHNGITYLTGGYLLRLLEMDPAAICRRYSHIIFDEVHERDADTDLLLAGLRNLMTHHSSKSWRVPKVIIMSATLDTKFFCQYFRNHVSSAKVVSIEVPGRAYPVTTSSLNDIWPTLLGNYPQSFGHTKGPSQLNKYLRRQLEITVDTNPTPAPAAVQHDSMDSKVIDAVEGDDNALDADVVNVSNVDDYYVPYDIIAHQVLHLSKLSDNGDILVFLPGIGEIEEVEKLLQADLSAINNRTKLYKLHSTFGERNMDVWEPIPPGCRRIILATNIAETSITLPNVKYVVDSGYSKQSTYEQLAQTDALGTRWISKAEVAQRKGRAGRTQRGEYYATYSQKQYDAMPETQIPELLRMNLDSIVLRTEASNLFKRGGDPAKAAGDIMKLVPSPPAAHVVDATVDQLIRIHALTKDGKVTPLGLVLSRMPVSPAEGKLVLMSMLFRCLGPGIVLATIDDYYPLVNEPVQRSAALAVRKQFAGRTYDDRLADTAAFLAYATADYKGNEHEKYRLRTDSFLRVDAYSNMARVCTQLVDLLSNLLEVPRDDEDVFESRVVMKRLFSDALGYANVNSGNAELLKAIMMSTSSIRNAVWDGRDWRDQSMNRVIASPRSVNFQVHSKDLSTVTRIRREVGDILAYRVVRSNGIRPTGVARPAFASGTTPVPQLTAMLFGESLRAIGEDVLLVNESFSYKIELSQDDTGIDGAQAAMIILEYRKALDRFQAYAFSQIAWNPQYLLAVKTGQKETSDYNRFLKNQDEPLRQLFLDSINNILKFSREHRRERMEARRETLISKTPKDSALYAILENMKGKMA